MPTQFGDTKRTLSTGDLVISVSEIFDRLQTKVDPNTLEQLLRDILAGRRDQVRPGELITAELINQMLAELESLQVRVTELEAGGGPVVSEDPVVITALNPSGPIPMQRDLRILGRGFGSPSSNVVTIDGLQVNQIKEGSNTELLIEVPLLAGVSEQGKTVTLSVSNSAGFAQTSLVVLPAVQTVPKGSLFATLSKSPTDAQLLAGQSYTFVFSVQAITNMEETFALTPTVSTGWVANIVDDNDKQIVPEIKIPKSDPPAGTTREVRVRVAIPAETAPKTTAQVKLAVVSNRNPSGLNKTSGGDTITVGAPPPPPQKVTVSFSAVISPAAPAPQAKRDENNVLAIPVTGTKYRVDFSILIEEPGTAKFNLSLLTPPSGWSATIQGSPSIDTTGTRLNRLVSVTLTALAGAQDGNLTLRVVKSDDPTFFGQFSQPIRLGT